MIAQPSLPPSPCGLFSTSSWRGSSERKAAPGTALLKPLGSTSLLRTAGASTGAHGCFAICPQALLASPHGPPLCSTDTPACLHPGALALAVPLPGKLPLWLFCHRLRSVFKCHVPSKPCPGSPYPSSLPCVISIALLFSNYHLLINLILYPINSRGILICLVPCCVPRAQDSTW